MNKLTDIIGGSRAAGAAALSGAEEDRPVVVRRIPAVELVVDAALFAQAVDVLGSEAVATDWFLRPARALDRQRPCDVATTAEGREQVSTLLGQIDYGVYI